MHIEGVSGKPLLWLLGIPTPKNHPPPVVYVPVLAMAGMDEVI